jgi:putative membrane protein
MSKHAGNWAGTNLMLWALLVFYGVARILQVFPGPFPMLAVVALHVLPPVVFALMHGAMLYRWRGILAFLVICLVIGNIFENVGVRTGFPFGHYYFTGLMGPKLFAVPILLGLAYVGMAYLSWTLARLILGDAQSPLKGARVVTLPVVAAFIMVAWDFSQDPVWSTILHLWIWQHGGAYFGVPVSNFLGWYLTVYVFYQLFVLYLRGRSTNPERLPASYWYQAVLFYAVSAAGNILPAIARHGPSMVCDPTGAQWEVSDITGTCALVSIFTMGAFALLAWVRLADHKAGAIRGQEG